MSKNNTDEAELSALMSRVLSAPLAPLRDDNTQLQKDLSQAATANNALGQRILGGLDTLTLAQSKMGSVIANLEELPDKTQDLADQLEELKSVVSTSEELKQLLKNQLRAQHVLGQQGHKRILTKLSDHQEAVDSLGGLIVENIAKNATQLLSRIAEIDAQLAQSMRGLEGAIGSVAQCGESVVAHLDGIQGAALTLAQVQQALENQAQAIRSQSVQNQDQIISELREGQKTQALLVSELSNLITNLGRQLHEGFQRSNVQADQALSILDQRQQIRSSQSFKWLLTLGVLNTLGVVACVAWLIVQR
ncbi:hypothetical protein NJC38_06580 [Pseudomonas sp. 21LCFQ010]|uniref:hypothetical protein n=1 Tax=Pseudomonas sp. 21LCFQ010 TaxID=2957506 RepID=UPI002096A88C|nr:hypothetical protein [Pseudomonas sp. 21LCFQ010]MCO8161821.1 hypothetical protein [Pseudomonas sp. 21LCFQ010]